MVSWSTSQWNSKDAGWWGWCDSHNGTYSRYPRKYLCGFWPQVFSGLFLSHSLQSFDQWDLNRYWKFMKCSWVSDLSSSTMWSVVLCLGSIYPIQWMYLLAGFRVHRILLSSRFVLHQDQDDLICTNADSKTGEKEAIRSITK